MRQEFEENGFYVLRGVLTDHEVDQLARPIREAFERGDYDTLKAGPAYPAPGIHSMGPRVLEEQPQLVFYQYLVVKFIMLRFLSLDLDIQAHLLL